MRGLNDDFMNDLLNGKLSQLLLAVKMDDTLCLEIRENYINIYYRGGNILKVTQSNGSYKLEFDEKYCIDNTGLWKTFDVHMLNKLDDYIMYMPLLKREMDNWLIQKKSNLEREFQQVILRENNFSSIAADTDYYISDIEYANTENHSRFDMTGIKWPSTASSRKKPMPSLTIFEVKYGDGAMTGNSGVFKHFADMDNFINNDNISKLSQEVEIQFNQKVKLGLIKDIEKKIKIDTNIKAEYILICANHKPASSMMVRELSKAMKDFPNLMKKVDIKIAKSSLMGYGLYETEMLSIKEFLKDEK